MEDFFENNDPTSLSTWMKMRNRVYDDRKKRVEQICRQMNVTTSSVKNSFDDAYSKVVDKDSGKYSVRRLIGSICADIKVITITE